MDRKGPELVWWLDGTESANCHDYLILMSANSIEQVPAYRATNSEISGRSERRKRGRIQVHWPVCFYNQGGSDVVETVTSDLSSNGFYFLARMPFSAGEFRMCTLGVPTNHPWSSASRVLSVECKVQIVRVNSHGDGFYGVGCRIDDYRFVESDRTAS